MKHMMFERSDVFKGDFRRLRGITNTGAWAGQDSGLRTLIMVLEHPSRGVHSH